jgi:hypothetical protein
MYVKVCTSFPVLISSFSLIVPGKIQVDLANFDVKLRENLLSTFFKITYSCRNVFQILFYFMGNVKKNYVHFNNITSKVWSWLNPAIPLPSV